MEPRLTCANIDNGVTVNKAERKPPIPSLYRPSSLVVFPRIIIAGRTDKNTTLDSRIEFDPVNVKP